MRITLYDYMEHPKNMAWVGKYSVPRIWNGLNCRIRNTARIMVNTCLHIILYYRIYLNLNVLHTRQDSFNDPV